MKQKLLVSFGVNPLSFKQIIKNGRRQIIEKGKSNPAGTSEGQGHDPLLLRLVSKPPMESCASTLVYLLIVSL